MNISLTQKKKTYKVPHKNSLANKANIFGKLLRKPTKPCTLFCWPLFNRKKQVRQWIFLGKFNFSCCIFIFLRFLLTTDSWNKLHQIRHSSLRSSLVAKIFKHCHTPIQSKGSKQSKVRVSHNSSTFISRVFFLFVTH